uniref:Secreted protein n=1 Tax=Heterorhabditis bacteriophora TaxID=37862 RepID=A0A1I7WA32_HETBA
MFRFYLTFLLFNFHVTNLSPSYLSTTLLVSTRRVPLSLIGIPSVPIFQAGFITGDGTARFRTAQFGCSAIIEVIILK